MVSSKAEQTSALYPGRDMTAVGTPWSLIDIILWYYWYTDETDTDDYWVVCKHFIKVQLLFQK